MAGYSTTAAKTTKRELPADVPDAAAEVSKGIPDGAVFDSDSLNDLGKPRQFRLRHPRTVPAEWEEVRTRKPRAKSDKPAADGGKPAAADGGKSK